MYLISLLALLLVLPSTLGVFFMVGKDSKCFTIEQPKGE